MAYVNENYTFFAVHLAGTQQMNSSNLFIFNLVKYTKSFIFKSLPPRLPSLIQTAL